MTSLLFLGDLTWSYNFQNIALLDQKSIQPIESKDLL